MKKYKVITGKLVARTAIHVGTGEGADVTDDICRRDVEGNYIIPGTAIAGALRALATKVAPRLDNKLCKAIEATNNNNPCDCSVCHLFGTINPGEGDTEETGGRASRLFVANAKAKLPSEKTVRIRDGVGIDRISSTAARAGLVKFDFEVLPAGTEFILRLELEDSIETDEKLLAVLMAEWEAGRAWLGGRVTRGLGAFDLKNPKFAQQDLSDTAGVLKYLKNDHPWEIATKSENWLDENLKLIRATIPACKLSNEAIAKTFVNVEFDLEISGPFLCNDTDAAAQSGFDHAPLLAKISPTGKPILPGASLRGVFRERAEWIARTVTTSNSSTQEDFLAKCPACNPMDSREKNPLASCDTLLREIANIPDDLEVSENQLCFGCRFFGSTRRGSRLIFEDSESKVESHRKVLDFLAIDRFTGGGKEGAKFDAFALWKPCFPIRIYLENPQSWELGWLTLVLRDLYDGMMSIGFGAAKGFGQPQINSFTWKLGYISEDDLLHLKLSNDLNNSKHSGIYNLMTIKSEQREQSEKFKQVQQKWIDEFHAKLAMFKREEKLNLINDSYFHGEIPELYKKEAYKCLLTS